jgi:hypothetical protein
VIGLGVLVLVLHCSEVESELLLLAVLLSDDLGFNLQEVFELESSCSWLSVDKLGVESQK